MNGLSLPSLQVEHQVDGLSVCFAGCWTTLSLMEDKKRQKQLLAQLVELKRQSVVRWSVSDVGLMDHFGAQVIWRLWDFQFPKQVQMTEKQRFIFKNLQSFAQRKEYEHKKEKLQPIVVLGNWALSFQQHFINVLSLLGATVLALKGMLFHPKTIPWREISANLFRSGVQALPIIALVAGLIGVVLSYLSAQQLQVFGANRFIVDILGLSIVRELGPMLAAILIAGRSGSAITAQIGVMRVTEELDAMQVMGISQVHRLVVPKLIALAIALPLLIIWTNLIALLGGALVARWELGISFYYFFHSLPDAVGQVNLWIGLGKGAVFGMLIALMACYFGFKVQPNSQSLGEGTTISVVTSITIVIFVDAIFAILFQNVGMP